MSINVNLFSEETQAEFMSLDASSKLFVEKTVCAIKSAKKFNNNIYLKRVGSRSTISLFIDSKEFSLVKINTELAKNIECLIYIFCWDVFGIECPFDTPEKIALKAERIEYQKNRELVEQVARNEMKQKYAAQFEEAKRTNKSVFLFAESTEHSEYYVYVDEFENIKSRRKVDFNEL
jgi:hypothetical protein